MTKKRIKKKKRHFKMSLFYYTDYTEMKAEISHVNNYKMFIGTVKMHKTTASERKRKKG